MVTSFARPGLDDAASLVPCFKAEGSGFRLAAFTILPDEDVAVADVDGAGS
jgi:hypothetical protein